MRNSLFNQDFTEVNKIATPKDVVLEQCAYLIDKTEGKVIARIADYLPDLIPNTRTDKPFTTIPGDPRNVLGAVYENTFTYEFFLSGPNLKYKYRAFFLYYSIPVYPALLCVDQSIADEINKEQDTLNEYLCQDEEQLYEMLGRIFNTPTFVNIVKAILSIVK